MRDALLVIALCAVVLLSGLMYFHINAYDELKWKVYDLERRMGQVAWLAGEAEKKVEKHFLLHQREITGISILKGRVGFLEGEHERLLKELANPSNQELY